MARHLMAKIEGYGREYRIVRDDSKEWNKFYVYRRTWYRTTCTYRARVADRFDTYIDAMRYVTNLLYTDPIKLQ